jgi:protease-4
MSTAPQPSAGPPPAPQPQPQYAPPPQPPLRVILEQRSSALGRLLRWGVGIVLVFSLLANISMLGAYNSYLQPQGQIKEQYHSLNPNAQDKVAILSIDGPIFGGEVEFAKRQIDQIGEDAKVKAIVLRVDSPGGTISGSDYIYHHLTKMVAAKKVPLVVSMGSLAASGGYYVSMAVGETSRTIYAEPTTWTGSIGVIVPHYDVTGLLEKIHVKDDSVASHPLKQMLSPTHAAPEKVREEERKIVQKLVDDSFERFKHLVLGSRPALRRNPAWQEQVFTGRVFSAQEARDNGLVDELGFLEDAVARATSLAGLDKANVRVVQFERPVSLTKLLLSEAKASSRGIDWQALSSELAVPRAWYLFTYLPGMTAGR